MRGLVFAQVAGMKLHLICFVLLAAACTKSQSDTMTIDTAQNSAVDTSRTAAVDTPSSRRPVEKFALLSPAAGDTLVEGRTYIIRWTPGPVRHVNLGAAMGGHDKGLLLNNVSATQDSLAWRVPIGFVTGFGPPSSDQVRLRLENADSTEQWVETGPFVIRGTVQR